MEHTSEKVAEGKLLGENSYSQRAQKYTEIEVGGSKIDFYDAANKVVHEVKKSDKMEDAHAWQVKYYIWLLENAGVENVTGIIEYPTLKQIKKIEIADADRQYIVEIMQQIKNIVYCKHCPPLINSKICKRCAYYDFCYINNP
jgi:CRISPR-associated exonuclease Cas4